VFELLLWAPFHAFMAICEALAGVLHPVPPGARWMQRLTLSLIGIAIISFGLCIACIVARMSFGIGAACFASSLLSAFAAGSLGRILLRSA
jgi:hypothetical protein